LITTSSPKNKGNFTSTLSTNSRSFLQKFVVQIIDHHINEGITYISYPPHLKGSFPELVANNSAVIEPVGSNSTLVAQEIFASKSPINSDNVLLKTLLAGILLDTVDLQPKYGKVTSKDTSIVNTILENLGITNSQAVIFSI
jgi:inorganic pyrophosphatase/exopolyphosphatase